MRKEFESRGAAGQSRSPRQQNTDDLFARMAARAEQIESDRKAIGQ
jgi:hypothetical protein